MSGCSRSIGPRPGGLGERWIQRRRPRRPSGPGGRGSRPHRGRGCDPCWHAGMPASPSRPSRGTLSCRQPPRSRWSSSCSTRRIVPPRSSWGHTAPRRSWRGTAPPRTWRCCWPRWGPTPSWACPSTSSAARSLTWLTCSARLVRLNRVWRRLDERRPLDWGQVAADAGHADQAHLIRTSTSSPGPPRPRSRPGRSRPRLTASRRSIPFKTPLPLVPSLAATTGPG